METNEIMNSSCLTLEFVQNISTQWANQFDNIPVFPFQFTLSEDSMISFHNTPLCAASEIKLNSEYIDVEDFSFETSSGDAFYFIVEWPYNSDITAVTIYKNDEMIGWAEVTDLKLAGNF